MPIIKVEFYADANGNIPVHIWLRSLPKKQRAKGYETIHLLADKGYELHRPYADYLRDGIYELRWKSHRVNYRILYFFHGRKVVFLTNGFTKERKVPNTEINLALQRKSEIEEKYNAES